VAALCAGNHSPCQPAVAVNNPCRVKASKSKSCVLANYANAVTSAALGAVTDADLEWQAVNI